MRYGSGKLNMAHTLTSYLIAGYFNAATFTDLALVTDSLILTAGALPVLLGSENLFAEKTASFRLLCAVVDCFGAFYNAIANDGKMVRPRFVTKAVRDGSVVEEYPVEVINPKICSDTTLTWIHTILRRVVSQGLAKPAGSKQFSVSGKTGTAQVSQGSGGYKSGTVQYLVSFCGYFPSEHPKYSCIVSIRIPHGPASGGLMAGSVFSRIAERVYAKDLTLKLEDAIDSTSVVIPSVKDGDLNEAARVLTALDIKNSRSADSGDASVTWGKVKHEPDGVTLQPHKLSKGLVPNVKGMGAKDAVYLLEQAGLKVSLEGIGHVYQQSLPPGSRAVKGRSITLKLRN